MIIILPCAGGSASNYNKYKEFSNDIIIYEYPGHWSRYEEPLEISIDRVVCGLCSIIKERNSQDEEITLFGHSMGGLVAWRLAQKLIDVAIHVKKLYIAACCPPEIRPEFIEGIRNDSDIKTLLQSIRQIPDKVLNSEFFNEYLLPIIRNDFLAVKAFIKDFQSERIKRIAVPIICLYGENDPVIMVKQINKWRNYTCREFSCFGYPGNHFFVYDKENIEQIMKEVLS